jgi:hypothetical protein
VDYKIALLVYKAPNGMTPQYIADLLSYLRSDGCSLLQIPKTNAKTLGDRSFHFVILSMLLLLIIWNSTPGNQWRCIRTEVIWAVLGVQHIILAAALRILCKRWYWKWTIHYQSLFLNKCNKTIYLSCVPITKPATNMYVTKDIASKRKKNNFYYKIPIQNGPFHLI